MRSVPMRRLLPHLRPSFSLSTSSSPFSGFGFQTGGHENCSRFFAWLTIAKVPLVDFAFGNFHGSRILFRSNNADVFALRRERSRPALGAAVQKSVYVACCRRAIGAGDRQGREQGD